VPKRRQPWRRGRCLHAALRKAPRAKARVVRGPAAGERLGVPVRFPESQPPGPGPGAARSNAMASSNGRARLLTRTAWARTADLYAPGSPLWPAGKPCCCYRWFRLPKTGSSLAVGWTGSPLYVPLPVLRKAILVRGKATRRRGLAELKWAKRNRRRDLQETASPPSNGFAHPAEEPARRWRS